MTKITPFTCLIANAPCHPDQVTMTSSAWLLLRAHSSRAIVVCPPPFFHGQAPHHYSIDKELCWPQSRSTALCATVATTAQLPPDPTCCLRAQPFCSLINCPKSQQVGAWVKDWLCRLLPTASLWTHTYLEIMFCLLSLPWTLKEHSEHALLCRDHDWQWFILNYRMPYDYLLVQIKP